MEAEAEREIDRILFEITTGALGKTLNKMANTFCTLTSRSDSCWRRKRKFREPCSLQWPYSRDSYTRAGPETLSSHQVYAPLSEVTFHVPLALHLCCEAMHFGECWYFLTLAEILGSQKDCSYEGGIIKCTIFSNISLNIFPFSHDAILETSWLNVDDAIYECKILCNYTLIHFYFYTNQYEHFHKIGKLSLLSSCCGNPQL